MYDELTEVDIKKMEEEIRYRRVELMPQLMAEMKRTREFGDLSENAEYKEAKREKIRKRRKFILKNFTELVPKEVEHPDFKKKILISKSTAKEWTNQPHGAMLEKNELLGYNIILEYFN